MTRFEYDLLGRITRMVDPAGQETLYSCSTQTPSGTIYGYWDSPLEVDLPGGTEPVHKCMYDSCGRTIQSDGTANAYDQLGRLKRATYPDRTYATFYYDKDSRLTEARLFGADGKPVCKTGTDYDARGRKTGEWWDVWGRLLAIPSLFGTGAFDPGFFYAQSGALSRIGRANGVPTVIAEDVRGRVDRITHGQGGQPILDLDYEYDSVGNVVRISGREYTYDRLGRLVGYQRPAQSGALEWVGYGYDLVGNRISESAGSVIGRRYSYDPGNYLSRTIDQTGRIESAFTYGSFGEQLTRTSGGVATNCVYDAAQRLREASRDGAVIASAVYDALGRRVGYTDSSGTVLTLYSGNHVVYELTNPPVAPDNPGTGGSGGRPGKQPGWIVIDDPVGPIFLDPDEPADPIVISPRLPGGGSQPGEQGGTGDSGNPGKPGNPPPPEPVRIAARYIVAHGKYLAKMVQEGESAAQTYFLHTDMLGSIRAVTDSAGQVVARFDYEPFGLLVEELGPAWVGAERYTGKPRDAALGLYYFGARYYDPELGRFITADPARQGLNWYVYCSNDPLGRIDPSGLVDYLYNQDGTLIATKTYSWFDTLLLSDRFFVRYPEGNLLIDGDRYFRCNSRATVNEDTGWSRVDTAFESVVFHERRAAALAEWTDKSLTGALTYIRKESVTGELLDQKQNLAKGTLFLFDHVLYNRNEAGNIIWGAALRDMGIPEIVALVGAHYGSYFFTSHRLDEMHDQRAIKVGWRYRQD